MDPFPRPLFPLICSSLCVSTVALIFSTLTISVSPILWIYPAAFIATVAYHAITLLISGSESSGSLRLFSLANLASAYVLIGIWTSAFGVGTALAVLSRLGKLERVDASKGVWSMIIPCIFSLVESIVMGFIAVRTRKERKRILYAAKWQWRPGHGAAAASQWSIGQPPPG